MIKEKCEYIKTREALAELSSILDASVREDRSKMYAGLTVGSLVAFGALAGVGACAGIDSLQYVAVPCLFAGMVSSCKAYEVNGFEVTEDAMYKFMVDSNPKLANKNENEVKAILNSYKENNNEINKQYNDRNVVKNLKKFSVNNYAGRLQSLKEM